MLVAVYVGDNFEIIVTVSVHRKGHQHEENTDFSAKWLTDLEVQVVCYFLFFAKYCRGHVGFGLLTVFGCVGATAGCDYSDYNRKHSLADEVLLVLNLSI